MKNYKKNVQTLKLKKSRQTCQRHSVLIMVYQNCFANNVVSKVNFVLVPIPHPVGFRFCNPEFATCEIRVETWKIIKTFPPTMDLSKSLIESRYLWEFI